MGSFLSIVRGDVQWGVPIDDEAFPDGGIETRQDLLNQIGGLRAELQQREEEQEALVEENQRLRGRISELEVKILTDRRQHITFQRRILATTVAIAETSARNDAGRRGETPPPPYTP